MAKYDWHKGFYYYIYHNQLQMVRRNYTADSYGTGHYYTCSSYWGYREGTWHYFDLEILDNPETVKEGYLYLTERDDEKAKSLFLENAKKELAYQESRREWLTTIKEGA